jgi:hypothetical protein
VNYVKNLEGFLNALDDQIEGAKLLVDDGAAFLAATRAIETLLAEDWPAVEAGLRDDGLSADDRQRLLQLLESINALETKTRARLAWSEDFEAHMRRAMETTS